MCNNWPNLPIGVDGATGGLIGDTVIICGGYHVDECYTLTSEKATLVTHMSVGRRYAASIVLNDNTLWVTGGRDDNGTIASTEYVTVTETMPGPDLPMALFLHVMVAINSSCSMVIAGLDSKWDPSASTFFYDCNEGEWINGSSLIQARTSHAAGIVTDEVTGEHFVAVTGGHSDSGGYHSDYHYLDSTEILQDGNWVQGSINDATICYLFGKLMVSRHFYRIS